MIVKLKPDRIYPLWRLEVLPRFKISFGSSYCSILRGLILFSLLATQSMTASSQGIDFAKQYLAGRELALKKQQREIEKKNALLQVYASRLRLGDLHSLGYLSSLVAGQDRINKAIAYNQKNGLPLESLTTQRVKLESAMKLWLEIKGRRMNPTLNMDEWIALGRNRQRALYEGLEQ